MVTMRVFCVFLCFLVFNLAESQEEVLLEEAAMIESLVAPTGGVVELPCDVTAGNPDEQMGLVIWYKQGHESPIYSVDTREGVTSHWSDSATLGTRATFRSDTKPAVLVITKLRPEDSGQYRCRVDFIKSPTKNSRLNLTILIPPERLLILNHDGNEVKTAVGPYDEGTQVNLTCVAVGGRPIPRVSWWKSHELLANSEGRATVSFTMHRADLGSDVTCQAVTDPSIAPISESVTVDINLRPLWLRLQGGKRPLVAGQTTELTCQSVGARPKPIITWWKGGTRLKNFRESSSNDGNVTSSILSFVPSIDDAGRVISCRAVQPTLVHSIQEDGWKMEIQHLPVSVLELGASLDSRNIVEGSDVYIDCRVRANPWHTQVYFTHNGEQVKTGPGVLLANQSLVLQKVSRKAAGEYVCVARNSLGEGFSDKLVLDVKYSPNCGTNQPTVIRAAKGEIVDIECSLDANPAEPMAYQWWFNSSTHTKHELTPSSISMVHHMAGTFMYPINSSSDYGWVQCSGTNSIGRQIRPCLFHIIPADKPSSLKSCNLTNVTYNSLTLNCTPGHDGGIRQSFYLQVTDSSTGQLLTNLTTDEPEFFVTGLSSDNSLTVTVKAINKKGQSEPLELKTNLLKYPQRHTAQVPVKVELTTVLLIVLGAVGIIATLSLVSATVYCCKFWGRKENHEKNKQDEASNVPLTFTKESESADSLDKNPDIIPLDGKISDTCSNKSSTTDYSSIRPLLTKNCQDKYDPSYSYDQNIDNCNQYIQIRPVDYRIRPSYSNFGISHLGPSVQTLGQIGPLGSNVPLGASGQNSPMPNLGMVDKTYEDWLKYKNALPMNTAVLLPPEQLMPPELFSPPSLYSSTRNPLNLTQMPELEPRSYLEPRQFMHHEAVPNLSPPVRFGDNCVYYNKTYADKTHTFPHLKIRNGSQENKKTTQNNEDLNVTSQEC